MEDLGCFGAWTLRHVDSRLVYVCYSPAEQSTCTSTGLVLCQLNGKWYV
jgi:hypothetical protein